MSVPLFALFTRAWPQTGGGASSRELPASAFSRLRTRPGRAHGAPAKPAAREGKPQAPPWPRGARSRLLGRAPYPYSRLSSPTLISILAPSPHTHRYFSFFTHLSYIGIVAYEFAAGVQTLCYVLNGAKSYPLQAWPRPLQFLHRLLYSTITSFRECSPSTPFFPLHAENVRRLAALVVTVVFWALLADSSTLATPYSGAHHPVSPSVVRIAHEPLQHGTTSPCTP